MSFVSSKPELAKRPGVARPDRLFNGLFGGMFLGAVLCWTWQGFEIGAAKRTLMAAGVKESWFGNKVELFRNGEQAIWKSIPLGKAVIAGGTAGLILAWLRIRRMRPNAVIVSAGLALTVYVVVWAAQSYLRLREVVPREVQSALQEVKDWQDQKRAREEREAAEKEEARRKATAVEPTGLPQNDRSEPRAQ